MPCPKCKGFLKRVRGQFETDYKKVRCIECKDCFILSGNVAVESIPKRKV